MRIAITATLSEVRRAPVMMYGPIEKIFSTAKDYGFDAVELHLRNPAVDVDWDELLSVSEKYSLPVTTLGTGMAATMDGLVFTADDPDVRKKAVDRVNSHIELAKLLKSCVTIGILNGNIGSVSYHAERRKKYHFDCLKQCVKKAEAVGVTVLLEPLNRYECDWLNTAQDALVLIERLNSSNVKYLADTFHMNIEEVDIADSVRRAGKQLGYIHLVDSNRRVPGYGHLPFADIVKALKDINYDGYLAFECLPIPDSKTASVDGINFVRRLL